MTKVEYYECDRCKKNCTKANERVVGMTLAGKDYHVCAKCQEDILKPFGLVKELPKDQKTILGIQEENCEYDRETLVKHPRVLYKAIEEWLFDHPGNSITRAHIELLGYNPNISTKVIEASIIRKGRLKKAGCNWIHKNMEA